MGRPAVAALGALVWLGGACTRPGSAAFDACADGPAVTLSPPADYGFSNPIQLAADGAGWGVFFGRGPTSAGEAGGGFFGARPGDPPVPLPGGLFVADPAGGFLECAGSCQHLDENLHADRPPAKPIPIPLAHIVRLTSGLVGFSDGSSGPPMIIPLAHDGSPRGPARALSCIPQASTGNSLACLVPSAWDCAEEHGPSTCSYRLRRLGPDGTPLASDTPIAHIDPYVDPGEVALAARPDGFLVAWIADTPTALALTPAGAWAGVSTLPGPSTLDVPPLVAVTSTGYVVATTWRGPASSRPVLQYLDPTAQPIAPPQPVGIDPGPQLQYIQAIAAFDGGVAIVVDGEDGVGSSYTDTLLFRALGCPPFLPARVEPPSVPFDALILPVIDAGPPEVHVCEAACPEGAY